MSRLTRRAAVAVALAVIAAATLQPGTVPERDAPMLCLVCGSLGMVDVLLNVALFAPLGAALVWAGMTWPRAILTCLAASFAVESLQFTVITGRDSTLSDLLTNTTGGAFGGWLVVHGRALLAPSHRQAQRLAAGGAALALAVMAATAWLLAPAMPRMLLWGQWAPQHQSFEPYTGHVARFDVNGMPAPYDLLATPDSVRAAYRRYEAVAHLEFLSGRAPTRTAAIARLVGEGWEVFLLGARGDAFIFRASLRTRLARLRTPSVAIDGALGPAGENVAADVQLQREGWRVRVARTSHVVERLVPFSVAMGWSFVLPFEHPFTPADAWWSALWLAALVLPCALGSAHARATARSRRDALASMAPVALVALGLAVIPALAHFAPASPLEWGGLLAGVAAGTLVAPAARRRAMRLDAHSQEDA